MKRASTATTFFVLVSTMGLLMGASCNPFGGGRSSGGTSKKPDVVGVMYHNWWTRARWSDRPLNHPHEPVLGHYNNADTSVVLKHIDWAQAHGINTFVIDFWITDRDDHWTGPNTRAVVDACDARGMNYFFLIDGWFEFKNSAKPAYEIARRVNAKAAPYFGRPGYLKQDGKPVVFFWAAYNNRPELFREIRSGIEGTSGPIFMTGDLEEEFDMQMLYNPYTESTSDYDRQIDRQRDLWKRRARSGKPWSPTALPGYDDTLVRPGNPPVPLDPDFFRRSIRTALQHKQNHRDGSRWLFINSWSEWHEGSNIEPSADLPDPYIFLKVLKQELDRLPD